MPEFLKLLQGHEDYLAQLGSHTKPALRTPQFPLETPSAESGPQEAIFQVEETGTGQWIPGACSSYSCW
eukprot:m.454139 g.454139  ORF g.454139 m.454139 type:complete len:69 (-) comp56945_c0_seq5:501-707(-)